MAAMHEYNASLTVDHSHSAVVSKKPLRNNALQEGQHPLPAKNREVGCTDFTSSIGNKNSILCQKLNQLMIAAALSGLYKG
ncbi:hypothetical protein D3C79_915590 [compost metagenome]